MDEKAATTAFQNAIQCYHVIQDETPQDLFFERIDRIESSQESEPVPSTSGMSEIVAWPPSPIVDSPSALPSPTSSPSSSQ